MAFNTSSERALNISIDLGGVVSARVAVVANVRQKERAISEAKFQQTVIDQGLSYDAQLEYRKKQIELERGKASPDLDYIMELGSSVSSIRQLNRFKKIREDYLSNYEKLKSGSISLKDHEGFLLGQLRSAPDEESRKQIRDEISTVRGQISESEINTLNNRVLLAEKDGTVNSLQEAIDLVSKRKAFADLAGNAEESTAWDVSLLSLRKNLQETKIENSIHDIDLNITRKGGNSSQKLGMLNDEISKADATTPLTLNGVTYDSAKDYWESKRDGYISGTSTDPNFQSFFKDFEAEVKTKIDTVSKINSYGFVPIATLESIQNDYRTLTLRSEFQNQLDNIENSKIAALSYGVDKSAGALIDSSVESLQLNSGLEALNSLSTKFGINLDSRKAELQQNIISKGSQLSGIKDATAQLGRVGAETPSGEIPDNLTPEGLLKQNNQVPTTPVTPPSTTIPPAGDGTVKPPTETTPPTETVTPPAGTEPAAPVVPAETVIPKTEPVLPKPASSQGFNSVVDYLKANKLDSSFAGRAKLFEERGLGKAADFKGTADQNTKLLQNFA